MLQRRPAPGGPPRHVPMRFLQPLVYVDAIARAGSIRRAAETLAITSTALNRRVLALEEELDAPLFERLPGGVRLSAAGELFVHHARRELAEMGRLRERIDDLAGERRGHVNVACGQALMHALMPRLVGAYRQAHPAVTFAISICTRLNATLALESFSADLAVVFEPEIAEGVETLARMRQPVRLLCRDDHPLVAGRPDRVSFDDCFDWPMALPTPGNGVRRVLEQKAARLGRRLPLVIESDSTVLLQHMVLDGDAISFQIPVGLDAAWLPARLVHRGIAERDDLRGEVRVLQLKGRTLPVPAARFAERLQGEFAGDTRGEDLVVPAKDESGAEA